MNSVNTPRRPTIYKRWYMMNLGREFHKIVSMTNHNYHSRGDPSQRGWRNISFDNSNVWQIVQVYESDWLTWAVCPVVIPIRLLFRRSWDLFGMWFLSDVYPPFSITVQRKKRKRKSEWTFFFFFSNWWYWFQVIKMDKYVKEDVVQTIYFSLLNCSPSREFISRKEVLDIYRLTLKYGKISKN